MRKEITYKLQGNGLDSWNIKEFDFDENQEEKLINAYVVYEKPTDYINTLKEAFNIKLEQIDSRTQELIFQGFAFAGLHWSLSIKAQINWTNLPKMPEFAFPLNMQDMDGTDYVLSYEERMNFYYTAMAAKNTHLQSGNALKTQVSELTNIEEILNFVDPR